MHQPAQRHPESPWFRVAMDIAMDIIVMVSSFDVMIRCSGVALRMIQERVDWRNQTQKVRKVVMSWEWKS